jgi:hypothetical protein
MLSLHFSVEVNSRDIIDRPREYQGGAKLIFMRAASRNPALAS